ncbi:MAG: HD-GYP domain-containing protein [Tepidiformaceae bacterium]
MKALNVLRSPSDRFVLAVSALGLLAFGGAFLLEAPDDVLGLGALVILCALAEYLAVRLYFDGSVSVGFVGIVVGVVLFGAPGGALAATAVALSGRTSERSFRKLAFNFGQLNVAAFVASAGILATQILHDTGNAILALITGGVAGTVVFAVTASAVSVVMSLTSGRSIGSNYRENFAWLFPHHLALGVVGGGLALAYDRLGVAGLLVFATPLLLSRYTMKQFVDRTRENVLRLEKSNDQLEHAYVEIRDMSSQLQDAYQGTLESLVAALDMRDQETRGHSSRVAYHSVDVAKMLGMKDDDELAMIYRGALMHDVGKIGVPDAILLKPAALTEEEWTFMRRHPALGYRILAQVPYLRPAARIVLAHHERWDGGGYPRRLKAEDIPLGARIFALCDSYDAIISDRPYRKGQSPDAAFAEILRCAGEQFDPKVVEAFEALFPKWREETHGANPPLYLPAHVKGSDATGRAAG